jgi:REP element-mobilizing transposase RayT
MEIYGYCIMPIHVHLIFRSALGDPSGLIRYLKGFTSRKIIKAIADYPQESRLEWMFESAGKKNSKVKEKQFWHKTTNQ